MMEDADTLVLAFMGFDFAWCKRAVFRQDARYAILTNGIVPPFAVCLDVLVTEIGSLFSILVYESPLAVFDSTGRSLVEHAQMG